MDIDFKINDEEMIAWMLCVLFTPILLPLLLIVGLFWLVNPLFVVVTWWNWLSFWWYELTEECYE